MAEIANYKVASSPHKTSSVSTRGLMLDVLIALAPCLVCGVVFFGLYALLLVLICVATCFASEQIFNLIRKKSLTFDLSAIVTGVILGLNLPPRAPWYLAVIGSVFAIVFVKMLFGGLGKNFANPAAAARVFLLLAYSSLLSQYIGVNVAENALSADVVTAPTYLSDGVSAFTGSFLGVRGYWGYVLQLLFGTVGGSIGETCKIAVLAGGVYLTARRVIDWRIPVVYLLTAAVMSLICYGSAAEMLLQLLSGGLLFGAVFMATDYATSPKWRYNRVLYAIGLGVLTVIIRRYSSYPEGVTLAILIMNLLVPVLDKYILPVRFGQCTKSGKPVRPVMQWSMRGICLAMVAALVVAVPLVNYMRPAVYSDGVSYYVQEIRRQLDGDYVMNVKGGAKITSKYTQNLEYEIEIDFAAGRVVRVTPIVQSTKGYLAELSFFEGKTYDEIAALDSLKTDSQTSATKTNNKLREMIYECFSYLDYNFTSYRSLDFRTDSISLAEQSGSLYRFTIAGEAYLSQYDYTQPLQYAVTLDSVSGQVKYITTLRESTFGYICDKTVYIGKTADEIAAMTEEEIAADTSTGATVTTVSVQKLIGECFAAMQGLTEVSNG